MNREDIKNEIAIEIDNSFGELKRIAELLYNTPELGYKEEKTASLVKQALEKLGIKASEKVALTGFKGVIKGKKPGPKVALLGELDSIICHQHPVADKNTGAAHACGHFAQLVSLLGVATGLKYSGAMDYLAGEVCFMAVPAEEFVDLEYRERLVQNGLIKYKSGKQQAIYEGHFDDIDILLMNHIMPMDYPYSVYAGMTSNTFISKRVTYLGKESHAGAAPHQGVNALNMAMLALNNINSQRETFMEDDKVRVHSIILKGGDAVNVIPDEIVMETVVRGSSVKALQNAVEKVDRCLIAGAIAVGGNIIIKNDAGYLPLVNNQKLMSIYSENMGILIGKDKVCEMGSITASFDFGDITHLKPGLHSFICAAEGNLHTKEFNVADENLAYKESIKGLAFTLVDLLYDDGKIAKEISSNYKSFMTKECYLKYLEDNSKTLRGKPLKKARTSAKS
ncbi:MAG: hypothetical protein APF76_10405 [Desulfitibacter sp. BRH_c19]|nr:MAG: hypothetical protein APF76_10405 [Desulfitibacter sp. BRH_c19]